MSDALIFPLGIATAIAGGCATTLVMEWRFRQIQRQVDRAYALVATRYGQTPQQIALEIGRPIDVVEAWLVPQRKTEKLMWRRRFMDRSGLSHPGESAGFD